MSNRPSSQPGPQTAFARSSADIAIFGGAAGGGKSWALVAEGARVASNGGAAVIFRRTSVELTGGGSIWDEASELYSRCGATLRQHPTLDARFPGGGIVEFRHLQHENDVYGHQGKQYDLVGFDELTHFTHRQFWYLYSRLRTRGGQLRPYVRGTCNPDPNSFVRKLVDWWIGEDGYPFRERAGVLRWFVRDAGELHWSNDPDELQERFQRRPQSLTFVPATLDDNAILTARDPDYRSKLMALEEVERARLLGGNWDVRDTGNLVYAFDAERNLVDELPAHWSAEEWVHGLALDFGVRDDFAWSVMGAHRHETTTYLLETDKRAGLLVDDMAAITGKLVERYRPQRLACDPGGGGTSLSEQWNRRHSRVTGLTMHVPPKNEKRAHIDLFNTELRTGRVKAVRGSCQAWVGEVQILPWADERRLTEHPAYANHCADATLYCWRDMTAFWHAFPKGPPPKLAPDDPTRIAQEWQAIQRKRERPFWDDDR